MKKGVLSVIFAIGGAALGAAGANRTLSKQISDKQKMSDKYLNLYLLMNQWVKLKQKGINLSQYFEKNGYRRIAIYGMSYAGQTLVEELRGTRVEVAYGIDENAENIWLNDISVLSIDDKLGDVDAIVVTAISYYDNIKDSLSKKLNCPIVSLKDILYEEEDILQ